MIQIQVRLNTPPKYDGRIVRGVMRMVTKRSWVWTNATLVKSNKRTCRVTLDGQKREIVRRYRDVRGGSILAQ